jgi:SAM-dependent methyltransferase
VKDDVAFNRAEWEAFSAEYQRRHARDLSGGRAAAWGLWRIPEAELKVLGDVAGKDVLEFGCGGAQWSIALARRGARAVGLDISRNQLAHAAELVRTAGVEVALVLASGDAAPFASESFDIVFNDYGVMLWVDPYDSVPEAARLLRPGGLLAFLTTSPMVEMTFEEAGGTVTTSLHRDYFGMHRIEESDGVEFQLPHGEWIRLFKDNGLVVEDLVEVRPPRNATTTYDDAGRPAWWARRWPAEDLWRVRKVST